MVIEESSSHGVVGGLRKVWRHSIQTEAIFSISDHSTRHDNDNVHLQ
jgi:hypothetical protein